MQEICLLNLDDGFQMQFINLDDLDHQHMNYPGFQVGDCRSIWGDER